MMPRSKDHNPYKQKQRIYFYLSSPECVKDWQEIEQGSVTWIVEPGLDGNRIVCRSGIREGNTCKKWTSIRLTRICPVRSRRIIQNENRGKISTDGGQVLGVGAEVERAVLAVVAPVEHALVAVQLVRHGLAVDLHAGSEHHELEPLRHLINHFIH